jgi:tRNA-2-methylthio-N6-dimethylallyladenosine synthase
MKYFIKTFGCAQNNSDSEKIEGNLIYQGMTAARSINSADLIIVNTCMVREAAENRVYGLVNNLNKKNKIPKIIVTGCMSGIGKNNKKYLEKLQEKLPNVKIEFTEELIKPKKIKRLDNRVGYVTIANGCNNFCSYCIVPYSRGKEVSRSFNEILEECLQLKNGGYEEVVLLGQNVNSYGSDLNEKQLKPIFVMSMGKIRVPSLFPHLLDAVAKMGFKKVSFMSSNPWDFSPELIKVIQNNKNISRTIHLPLQSGSSSVLKRMNRFYTKEEYLDLIKKINKAIPEIKFTTDIIVGFCDETDEEFEDTIDICKKVGFEKAYVAIYSPRVGTYSYKKLTDNISHKIKRQRWNVLEALIYKSRHPLS